MSLDAAVLVAPVSRRIRIAAVAVLVADPPAAIMDDHL
jgi:hypothetical protein